MTRLAPPAPPLVPPSPKQRKPRLTWRRQPSERGLARVCQSTRGAILKVDGEDVGRVYPSTVGFHEYRGWYWTARDRGGRIPLRNTCATPVGTLDEAKRACEAYVREQLAAAAPSVAGDVGRVNK